jgi:hypothetical protein
MAPVNSSLTHHTILDSAMPTSLFLYRQKAYLASVTLRMQPHPEPASINAVNRSSCKARRAEEGKSSDAEEPTAVPN